MLDVTVKTLDGKNTPFTVDDNMTVKSFKDHISGTIGIPADQQRIIFKGKVLQDDAKLADSDVAGKVVHVVMRPPPGPAGSSTTAGSASSTGSAAAPAGASAQARRPAAGSSAPPRRAAQPAAGTSVMVASFSLPGDITDTRQINSIVENVMRGIGPAGGGVHIHSQLDPLNSVDVHIDLREAQHEPLAGQGQSRGQEHPAVAEIAAVGGAEPRRCLQQIQSFVGDLEEIIDDLEQLRVDQAPDTGTAPTATADASSAGGAADAASRRVRASRHGRSERQGAHDDGNGRVPVNSLAEVLSQVSALSARLQPHIELYSSRVREVSAGIVQSRGQDTSSASLATERQSQAEASGHVGSSGTPDTLYRVYFETTSEAMHLLGHIYHNVSDLMVDWSRPPAERELLMTPVLGMPALMLGRHPLVVPVSVAAQSAVLYSPNIQPQQASAQPSQPPPSASERLSGSTQNVSAASQRLSGSSANVTRDGSGTGSGGDATSTSGPASSQPSSVPPAAASTGGTSSSGVPGAVPVQPMPSTLPLPFMSQQLLHDVMRHVVSLPQFSGQPYYTSHPPGTLPAANQPPAAGQPGGSNASGTAGSSPGVASAAAASTASPVAGRPVGGSATAQLQFAEGSLPPVVVLPQVMITPGNPYGPPSYSFGPPGHPYVAQRPPYVTSATASMPLAMVPPLMVPLQPPTRSQTSVPTVQQLQQPVPSSGQQQPVAASSQQQQQQSPLVAGVAQVLPPSGLQQQPQEHMFSGGQSPQDRSRAPTGVAGSGSQTSATVQGQFGSGSLTTGGLLDSIHQMDMYLPCNSLFWQPQLVQVVRQPGASAPNPASAASRQPPVSSATSRDAPRSGLNSEAVRTQPPARETENIATSQFHTMLSTIINSVINRAMQPPTDVGSAGGVSAPSNSAGPGSAGTTGSASGGARARQAESSGASQTSRDREPSAHGAQGIFDGGAFSSVLPAAIEQLAAFAHFVAEPAAADGRPPSSRISTMQSGSDHANPLPDEMFVQLMTAIAQEVAPNASSQRPASTIQDFLQRMASSHGLMAEAPTSAAAGIVHGFFDIISRHLTFADLQHLYDGDTRVLDKLRSPLSAFIRGQVLDDGPTTEENVTLAVDRLLEEWSPHLATALANVRAAGDIDLISTMKQFIRIHLKRAIMLVLSPAAGTRSSQQSDESFGRQLDAFIRGGAFNLCQLLLRCLGDDVEALLRIVYSQVEALFGGASTVVVGMTSTLISAQVESMLPHIRAASASAEDATRPYVVCRAKQQQPGPEQGLTKEASSVHASSCPSGPAPSQPTANSTAAAGRLAPCGAGCAEDDSSNYESADEMEVVQSESVAAPGSSRVDELLPPSGSRSTSSAQPDGTLSFDEPTCDSGGADHTSSSMPVADNGRVSEPLTGATATTAAASPADDWRSQVPQDWVPVIECDQRRQAEAGTASSAASSEQQPFSDAYLSGVPAKKRKVVASKDEPSSAE